MDKVYEDQIWRASQCRQIEADTYRQLRPHVESAGGQICLVDAVADPNAHKFIVTDNILSIPHFELWPEYYGSFWFTPTYQDTLPSRLFNCFVNRACPFRQSWMYQFIRRDLMHEGHISYRLAYHAAGFGAPKNLDDLLNIYDHMYHRGNHVFEKENKIFRDLVPLQTFDMPLEQAVLDSKISVVIETYFNDPDRIAFSEKIFRALSLPRPFVLFAAAKSVSHLRLFGFDVFDDLVDHAYDSIYDSVSRQISILDSLTNYKNLAFTTTLVTRLQRGCSHNRNLLKSFRNRLPAKIAKIIGRVQQLQ